MATIKMKAKDNFYDSNLNPKHVRKGQIFEVNDEVQAKDFEKLADLHKGHEKPAEADAVVPAGTVTGVERKAREAPLNKMLPDAKNKGA